MNLFKISQYDSSFADEWNKFNALSKNGTFLFDRSFMEYHKDRFEDHSLLIFNSKDELFALLPANINGDTLICHGGLTYGGIIGNSKMTTPYMIELFQEILSYLKQNKIKNFIYKTIPKIYHSLASEEDLYALFRHDAQLIRRDVISVIDYKEDYTVQERRLRSKKKADKLGLIVQEESNFSSFWEILTNILVSRHGVKPVHTVDEIKYLANLFPENIKLYICKISEEILAGVVMFITKNTAHAQYIAVSDEGLSKGALDLLFFKLIELYKYKRYFSFGISNENNGKILNEGLITQKEGFGARAICHDFYQISLTP